MTAWRAHYGKVWFTSMKDINITICIGSSCHLKGSREIVKIFERLISEHNLGSRIDLGGSFCMGQCMQGVCVKVNGELHSLRPDTAEAFFNDVILKMAA